MTDVGVGERAVSMLVPVCHALTGETLGVELADNAPISELRAGLQRQTDVDVENQVLICEWDPDRILDKRKTVAFYGLPREGFALFFFDKSWFKTGEGPAMASSASPLVEAALPTQEQSLASSSLVPPAGSELEPMHSAMLNYAASFAHWKATAEAYVTAGASRKALAAETLQRLQVQRRASALALASLTVYLKVVAGSLAGMEAQLDKGRGELSSLMGGSTLEAAIESLRQTALHPAHCAAVRVPAGTTLLSFVKDVDALSTRVEGCKRLQEALEEQIVEGRQQLKELNQSVEEEVNIGYRQEDDILAASTSSSNELLSTFGEVEEARKEFSVALENLERRITEPSMGQVKWEFMDNIQQKYSQGKERLAAVGQSDRVLQRKLEEIWGQRHAMMAAILRRLRVVAELQGRLQNRKKKWDTFLDVAKTEMRRHYAEVEIVLKLPATYRAWCEEVCRRRNYLEGMVKEAEATSGAVQRAVDAELERRLEYMAQSGALLPDPLHRLLNDGAAGGAAHPPRIEINVSGRPRMLPDIDLPEIPKPHLGALSSEPRGGGAGKGSDPELEKKLEEVEKRERAAKQEAAELRKKLEERDKELEVAREEAAQLKGQASAAQAAAADRSQFEEQMEGLEKELERKTRFLTEASENSARLELDLKFVREKLSLEKTQAEKLLRGLQRLGEVVGVEGIRGDASSARQRRASAEQRDLMVDETVEAIVAQIRARGGASDTGAAPKISLSGFEEGEVALFMPVGEGPHAEGQRVYMAFNLDCPRHFLDPASLPAFIATDPTRAENYCLGRILSKRAHDGSEADSEAYGRPGETLWICSAVPIQ